MINKVTIHFFTGTNNSLVIAKKIQGFLAEQGIDAAIRSMSLFWHKGSSKTDGNRPPKSMEISFDSDFKMHGHVFISPVYACGLPRIVREYLSHLPDGNNSPACVIMNNGEITPKMKLGYGGIAHLQAKRLLAQRQYTVNVAACVGYPHNVTVVGNPVSLEFGRTLIKTADHQITRLMDQFMQNGYYIQRVCPLNHVWCWAFNGLFLLVGSLFIGKLFVASPACTGCGQCQRECPVGCISLHRGIPAWNTHCEGCLRCFNRCPQMAIHISNIRLAFVFLLTIVIGVGYCYPLALWRAIGVPVSALHLGAQVGLGILSFGLVTAALFGAFLTLDVALRALERKFSWVRKALAWSYTRRLTRYDPKNYE